MYRNPFPILFILYLICLVAPLSTTTGQSKVPNEVDIVKCWTYPIIDALGTNLVSDGSDVFIRANGARIDTLSTDGKKMWSSELGGEITSNILPIGEFLILVTSKVSEKSEDSGDSLLRSLSKETGITNWSIKLPDAQNHFLGAFNGSVIVVSQNGVIQSVDTKSGIVNWNRTIAEKLVGKPAFTGDKVIVASGANHILAISLGNGETALIRNVPYPPTAFGETPTGEIIAGDKRGNIISFVNGVEKPIWKFKSGGEISEIVVIGTSILAASHDNFIYFLSGHNGDVVWKKRLSGRVSQINSIDDKYAFVSGVEDKTAFLAELTKGKIAGVVLFAEDEVPISESISKNGLIFLLTTKAAYAYSLNGCSPNKIGGTGVVPVTANLK